MKPCGGRVTAAGEGRAAGTGGGKGRDPPRGTVRAGTAPGDAQRQVKVLTMCTNTF